MSFKFYVSTNQLIRNLTKTFKDIEDYPKTKLGTPRIAIQYKNNKVFQAILWKNMVQQWNALGPAFNASSIVQSNLDVGPGSGAGNQGVAAYHAGFKNTEIGTKAFKIAEIWNSGGVILPRNVKYLAQPFSLTKRSQVSPLQYNTGPEGDETAFVDNKTHYHGSRDPRISQNVYGMLYIRKRKQGYVPSKKGKKVKHQTEIVARFLLLKSQTQKATRWIDLAAKKTMIEVKPIMLKTGLDYIRNQKVLS